jgi:tetratricopeptide (TPR) repeat protein/transcriptional regulator with XRE-family HTH domain
MEGAILSNFGELLNALRKQRHVTQQQLATRLGVHRNTIGSWERGDCLPESKTVVWELARQLHLDMQDTRLLLEASLTAIFTHWYVPHQRNPFFTGREDVLQQLHETLNHEHVALLSQSYALSGLGGIGKTQTAIEYAYRYANDYSAVFWISAETHETIVSSMVAIASQLNLPEKQEKEQEKVIAAVTYWLTRHSNWLLIFDNVEDPTLLKRILLAARGGMLFTSRRQALGLSGRTLDLEPMTPEEGICFLLGRASRRNLINSLDDFSPTDVALAREIVTAMDGLPLALDQAGGYIEETGCHISDYLKRYQTHRVALLNRRGSVRIDHPEAVVTTFSFCFDQVKQINPAAADLLCVCALLGADDIPERMIIEGASQLGPRLQSIGADLLVWDDILATLRKYSLLGRHPESRMLTIHRLVQVVLKELMDQDMLYLWVERTVKAVKQAFPDGTNVAMWPHCQQTLPHVEACARLITQWQIVSQDAARLLNQVGIYLRERGLYVQAEEFLCNARDLLIQVVGLDHPEVAQYLNDLAWLYRSQGRYTEAEPLFLRALMIEEQQLGSDHTKVAEILSNLAVLYWNLERYAEAETLFLRALAIKDRQLGREHIHTVQILNNIALLYSSQGRYTEAEPLFLQTLRSFEHQYEANHPNIARVNYNIAVLYHDQGRYGEAEPLYVRALAIFMQHLEKGHPDIARNLDKLALLYANQGRYIEAKPLMDQVLTIFQQTLGEEHQTTVATREKYAMILQVLDTQ